MTKSKIMCLLLLYDHLFTAFRKNKAHGLRGKLKISRCSLIKDRNTIVSRGKLILETFKFIISS